MLDQPLVAGRTREDGEEVRVLLRGPGIPDGPAVVGSETVDGRQLVERLPRVRPRDDAPGRPVPLLDHVAEVLAVVVRGEPDRDATRRGGTAHALEDRADDAGTASGSGSARPTRRRRSSSR